MAVELLPKEVLAITPEAYVPIDCYQENERAYGNTKGTKVSDINLISGLHPLDHRLNTISACTDMLTKLISGVTTTYAQWSNSQQINVYRMNVLGKMSANTEFDDNVALALAGLGALTAEQSFAFKEYWYQEASPKGKELLDQRKITRANESAWKSEREDIFNQADLNSDKSLNKEEAYEFFKKVRTLDGYTISSLSEEKLDRAWKAVSLLSAPSLTMLVEDYFRMEQIMEAWYDSGKLEATGYQGSTAS